MRQDDIFGRAWRGPQGAYKRNHESLIEKRDGRVEWLRATKLARSVAAALARSTTSSGLLVLEDGQQLDTTSAGLFAAEVAGEAMRVARRAAEDCDALDGVPLPSRVLACAVETVLLAFGAPAAARVYAAEGRARMRRASASRAATAALQTASGDAESARADEARAGDSTERRVTPQTLAEGRIIPPARLRWIDEDGAYGCG